MFHPVFNPNALINYRTAQDFGQEDKMIIWRLVTTYSGQYAYAIGLGEWERKEGTTLTIEWQPNSTNIGDLAVVGLSVIARKEVSTLLKRNGFCYKEGNVVVKRDNKRQIPPPETDKEIVEIIPNLWVNADMEKSSVKMVKDSSGNIRLDVEGIEYYDSNWDMIKKELVRVKISREPGKGLIVSEKILPGPRFFRIREFPAFFCFTDVAKNLLEQLNVSGVEFLQIGETR